MGPALIPDHPLALNMIVKGTDDEAVHLRRALKNVAGCVDGIFITVTHKPGEKPSQAVLDVAEDFADEAVSIYEWNDHFADARNFALSQVTDEYEWVLWLDADDTVVHPEKLRSIVANAGDRLDLIALEYLYDHDEDGNLLTTHWVPRIFRNNGRLIWKGRIHETLIDVIPTSKARNEEVQIYHHAGEKRRDASLERNIKLLELSIADEQDEPDPRTFFYLAGSYKDAGRWDEAIYAYEAYLKISGWPAERAQAWTQLGRMHMADGRPTKAQEAFLMAMGENPFDIEPWVELGSLKLEQNELREAVFWLEQAISKKPNLTAPTRNIINETYRPYMLLADAHMQLGGNTMDVGLKLVKAALKIKDDENTRNYYDLYLRVLQDRDLIRKTLKKFKAAKNDKQKREVLDKVPEHLHDNPTYLRMKKSVTPPKTWDKQSVVIFTGKSALEGWGPWSLAEGIGGSEEAIIRLSKRLVQQGYQVTVYADPSARAGTYDGVVWRNYWEIDMRDTFDVFIAWRMPWIFDEVIKARKRYLWLHDVVDAAELAPERLENLDKVMVLSNYHRSLFPAVPDDKIMLSANGIDPEEFEALDGKITRDPHKLVYTSSHVRGLVHLLDMWPDIKAAVPDATLDIYYGWQSYDAVNGNNPERMAWKEKIVAQVESLDGVTDHGRVSQQQIVEANFAAGIWAYPCHFPEIYCISAVKAQAAGATPVTTTTAALDQMVQFGTKFDMSFDDEEQFQAYKLALIHYMQKPQAPSDRDEMMQWARTSNSWSSVATQWIEEFES